MSEIQANLPEESHVGIDIRALRKRREMTLQALAETLGRSVGWLSQVERGVTSPAIRDLKQIATLFDLPISFFFRNDEAPQAEHGYVVRKDARGSLGSDDEGLIEQLLSPDLSGDFEMIHCRFAAHTLGEWREARPTEESGYLLSGELTIELRDRTLELNQGDSFRFRHQPFRWHNTSSATCEVIWVVSPPVY